MKRWSRFQVDIEAVVRHAATAFRDNDVETSVNTAVRLWWTSRLRGRHFLDWRARLTSSPRNASRAVRSLVANLVDAKPCPTSLRSCAISSVTTYALEPQRRLIHVDPPSPQTPQPRVPGAPDFSDLDDKRQLSLTCTGKNY
jgi:hypothetical protein